MAPAVCMAVWHLLCEWRLTHAQLHASKAFARCQPRQSLRLTRSPTARRAVFADVAFTGGTTLRETSDPTELAVTLRTALDARDLRRDGRLDAELVRAALTHGAPAQELTPYELRVLAGMALESGRC